MKLMRILARGLEIDAESGKGGVVHLVIRAQQQHQGMLGRIGQCLAHALYRIGDALQFNQQHRAVRVVEVKVSPTAADDLLPDSGDTHVREIWPILDANRDAHYHALLAHEGIKRGYDGRPVKQRRSASGQECRDDLHPIDFTPLAGRKIIMHSEASA